MDIKRFEDDIKTFKNLQQCIEIIGKQTSIIDKRKMILILLKYFPKNLVVSKLFKKEVREVTVLNELIKRNFKEEMFKDFGLEEVLGYFSQSHTGDEHEENESIKVSYDSIVRDKTFISEIDIGDFVSYKITINKNVLSYASNKITLKYETISKLRHLINKNIDYGVSTENNVLILSAKCYYELERRHILPFIQNKEQDLENVILCRPTIIIREGIININIGDYFNFVQTYDVEINKSIDTDFNFQRNYLALYNSYLYSKKLLRSQMGTKKSISITLYEKNYEAKYVKHSKCMLYISTTPHRYESPSKDYNKDIEYELYYCLLKLNPSCCLYSDNNTITRNVKQYIKQQILYAEIYRKICTSEINTEDELEKIIINEVCAMDMPYNKDDILFHVKLICHQQNTKNSLIAKSISDLSSDKKQKYSFINDIRKATLSMILCI